MLSFQEKQELLRKFPDVKLSYDRLLHRKVSGDLYFVIPKGPKAFLWITNYNKKNIAVILTIDGKGSIVKIQPIIFAFHNKLAMGTIIYGTLFNKSYFCFEDFHFLEGKNIEDYTVKQKLSYLFYLFKQTRQTIYSQITLGAPIMHTDYNTLLDNIHHLPYTVFGIQAHSFHAKNGLIGTHIIKQHSEVTAIFRVKATIQSDIYELYCNFNNNDKFYGIAIIPTYKDSVEMNNYFRNIKENKNLDLLEESDSEEEFENTDIDKYVDLNKSLVITCVYMPKFQKWRPDKIIDTNKLTDYAIIDRLEKK